jgi:hypothetical protein
VEENRIILNKNLIYKKTKKQIIMKTTIEIKGYEIVIEETEDGVSVVAVRDGETVEEFTLESEMEMGDEEETSRFSDEEEESDFEDADEYEDEMDELGQGEGEDFEDEDEFEGEEDDDDDDDDDESEEEDEEATEEEESPAPKLESFSSFISRKSNKNSSRNRR